ncbi:MAG: methanol/ethanol family PQQ-dependent dehydrogenase [Gemmatimonadaceae bacterium]|nr:methanol/ethanol family PQQ-dependent dehydrogenase [Gemmatimonadaceae bacterium]
MLVAGAFGALLFAVACSKDSSAPAVAVGRTLPAGSTTSTFPGADKPGEWNQPGRDWANTRFSPLDGITTANVANLKVAWTFSTGVLNGHEGQPLVVGSTMYVTTPWPNITYALDLADAHAPAKWAFAPPTAAASKGEACCDVVNRGAVYSNGKIIWNLLDGHTVAVDAVTGKQLWMTTLADINKGETMTMAPFAVKNKVFVGVSGAEMGIRGWIAALDISDGHVVWKAYSTGPDKDVLIGPNFKPYYAFMRGKDLGVTTWPSDQWKIGGASVWGWVTYDPETNLLFYGTGNPGAWNPDLRPGDNLWSMAIFARDPDTGEAKWAYQMTPHDMWDYDGINENIVADIPIDGQTRKVLLHAERNGFAYVIDRTNGQVINAQPFVFTNWATGIDLNTGRPNRVPEKETRQGVTIRNICPSSTGGKDQQPTAFSSRTGLWYIPATNDCMDYEGTAVSYIAGTPYLGADVRMYAGPGGNRGEFIAWDPGHGRKVWGIKENFPVWSGVLVTAGDVAFYGTMDGWFKAVDARTGTPLWSFKTGSGIIGNPIAYTGPDGKEYVAILTGVGGWMGAIVSANLSPDDPTAALGATGASPDLKKYVAPGGMLFVFGL